MRRGEVWLCTLDPTVGSEIKKTRPCVIVSPDEMNGRVHTVIVAPLTSGGRPAAWRVPARFGGVTGLIVPDQMRALDRSRLVKRLGSLDGATLRQVLAVLEQMFAV